MKKMELRRIWTWLKSQLDTRLITNVAVGVVLGLLTLEVIELLLTFVVAVVGVLTVMLFT